MRKFNTRILSLLMALVMSFSLVITAFAYDIPDGYTVDEFGRVISYDGTEVIGYMGANGEIMWFENSPYGAIGYMDANGNVVLTESNPADDQTQPDSIEIPTDDNVFVDEDLALVTKFKDVKTTAWYYNDVTECAKLGIVAGFEDGTFRPEDKVTAVQWVTMITRTFYNTKVETAQKSKPAGSPWYWANTKVASDEYLTSNMTINDNAMNRYDMANVTKNVIQLINNGVNSPSTAAKDAVPGQVKDWSSVPKNRTVAIKVCYATGVIAGMTDGKFHGEQSMTRAQACTVIMRMLKLINKYNPGDKDNDQYDDGKNQNTSDTGNQNQQTGSGKLANGKDATVANVQAILADIKKSYPDNTVWNTNTFYRASEEVRTALSLGGFTRSKDLACGGWASMVSEKIFGTSGNPGREVTSINDIRPGDLIIFFNSENKVIHASVVTKIEMTTSNYGPVAKVYTCDGNAAGGYVRWDMLRIVGGLGKGNKPGYTTSYRVVTRYPN